MPQTAVSEGSAFTVSGRFTDDGPVDTHTVEIAWGDGTVSLASVDAASRSFTASHTYADNAPVGTSGYGITATVADNDGATGTATAVLPVNNVVPVLLTLTNSAAEVGKVLPGEPVKLTGTFTDPGTGDDHRLIIDWGDGRTETVSLARGDRSFAINHLYANPGFFDIKVVLADDENATASGATEAKLTGVELIGRTLVIAGTAGADTVSVTRPSMNPVLYWSMNEPAGATLVDTAGTRQDGTVISVSGSPDLGEFGPRDSAPTFDAGRAVRFDGNSGSYVASADVPEFDLVEGSIQLWFSANDANRGQTLVAKNSSRNTAGEFSIRLNDGRVVVELSDGRTRYTITSEKLVNDQDWRHLAFTFGAKGMQLYLDGVLAGSNAFTGGIAGSTTPLVLGADQGNANNTGVAIDRLSTRNAFAGFLDEFAIFGRQLDATAIRTLRADGPVDGAPRGDVISVKASFLPLVGQPEIKTFTLAAVDRIVFYGADGNDRVEIDPALRQPTELYGGRGDDYLGAGGGASIILGDEGDDVLIGSPDSDILSGGAGNDLIDPNGGKADVVDGGTGIDRLASSAKPVQPLMTWTLDEPAGRSIGDAGRLGNTGTLQGDARLGAAGRDGSTALETTGSKGSSAGVAHNAAYELQTATIAFWVNPDRLSGVQTLFSKDGSGRQAGDFRIELVNDRLQVVLEDAKRTNTTVTTDRLSAGQWSHVAVTVGDCGVKLYLNGRLVGSVTTSQTLATNRNTLVFGASNETASNRAAAPADQVRTSFFDGRLDDMALYGQALDASRIQALVASGPQAAALANSGLLSLWRFNEHDGRHVSEVNGLVADGVVVGTGAQLGATGATIPGVAAGSALQLTGNGYVGIAHDAKMELADGAVSLWFNPASTCGTQVLLAKDGAGRSDGSLRIALVEDRIEVKLEGSKGDFVICTDSVIKADQWQNLVFVFGEEGMQLYLNGVLVGANDYQGGIAANKAALILGGANSSNASLATALDRQLVTDSFTGRLDQLNLFAARLTAGEVRTLYQRGAAVLAERTKLAPALSGALGDYRISTGANGQLILTDTRAPASTSVVRVGFDGSTITDAAGGLAAGQVKGSGQVTLGRPGAISATGSAVEFGSGKTSAVGFDSTSTLALDSGTIALWVKATSVSGVQTLVSKGVSGTNSDNPFAIRIDNGRIAVQMGSGSVMTDVVLKAGDWAHVAVSFGEDGLKIHLNGQMMKSVGYAGGIAGNDDQLVLGAQASQQAGYVWSPAACRWVWGNTIGYTAGYAGLMDDLAIFKGALSTTAIAALAERGATALAAELPTHVGPDGVMTITGIEEVRFADGVRAIVAGAGAEIPRAADPGRHSRARYGRDARRYRSAGRVSAAERFVDGPWNRNHRQPDLSAAGLLRRPAPRRQRRDGGPRPCPRGRQAGILLVVRSGRGPERPRSKRVCPQRGAEERCKPRKARRAGWQGRGCVPRPRRLQGRLRGHRPRSRAVDRQRHGQPLGQPRQHLRDADAVLEEGRRGWRWRNGRPARR